MTPHRLVFAVCLLGCGGIADAGIDSGTDGATNPPPDAAAADISVADVGATDVISVPADAGSAFTPAKLSNLVLWLEGSQNVKVDTNGNVTAWGDLSPSKNDASGSPYTAPTLLAGGIGGHPSVHFDAKSPNGLALQIADSTSLQWSTGDYLVAVVARYTNDPKKGDTTGSANFFWKSTYQGQAGMGVSLFGNVPLADGTVLDGFLLVEDVQDYVYSNAGYHDGVGRSFVAHRTGGVMELRVNGTPTSTQSQLTSSDVSAPQTPVVIGSLATDYYRLFGDIAEMVAVKGATAPSDIATLEAYFKAKYAL